jgi:hypothetical protein
MLGGKWDKQNRTRVEALFRRRPWQSGPPGERAFTLRNSPTEKNNPAEEARKPAKF